MATAEQGGATGDPTSSSYGGGGAGGKFRKKPFRRQTTPYDRPPTALRGNNNTSSWLTKLVVDPASKLISYGAERFFASVFRKRLPAPPPPQPPEVNDDVSGAVQGAIVDNQDSEQEPAGLERSQQINSSSSSRVSELEQLLKQKTFTRSEIVHLTELLQSRAVDMSVLNDGQKNEETASEFGRFQPLASEPLEENRNEGIRSSAVMSTPILNSKVLDDDIASPAELAKAYMGSRPSKVSPSMLGSRRPVGRDEIGLLSSGPFASKSPIMSLTKKTSVSLAAPENGFITPRSRGRSAIYNMARTPYSRVHPTSILKGGRVNSNGFAGPSMSSSSLSLAENDEKFESQPMTLKRRSSALDDEIGSVGPIRRIRQKSNLLAPGTAAGSHAKQKLQLIGETKHKFSKAVKENENESVPSTSYAHVPSKSNEVAVRILQHLEKLTPKEKSSETKLVAVREKSPLKLAPSVLSGQALRSMEDVDSSKLRLDVLDDHKLLDRPNSTLLDARDTISPKQGKVEDNGPKESVMNNDSAVSLKSSGPSTETADPVVKSGASQPPQKMRAFRMSAQEDSMEQDDNARSNGFASGLFSEKAGSLGAPFMDSKLSPAEEPMKPTIQQEVNSHSGLISNKRSNLSSPAAVTVGEGNSVIAFPSSKETTASSMSSVVPLPVAAFDKPKETNSFRPLFSFSSKVADKFPALPSDSSKIPESKVESFSSLFDVSPSTGSQGKIPELDKGGHLNPLKAGDVNGKSNTVPSAISDGPLVSSPPILFTAASSNDTKQTSAATGDALVFPSSTSNANLVPTDTNTSTPATSSGSTFGFAVKPSSPAAPAFKLGASVDQPSAVSGASATKVSEVADLRTKVELDPSSGNSSSGNPTIAAFAASNPGSSTFGLGSSVSYSTGNNVQGSLFAAAIKSPLSGAGSVSQATSVQSVPSASLPLFNMNSSSSFASSLSNSQGFIPNKSFGFSSSASSSDTSTVVPGSGPVSSLPKFGASSAAVSKETAVSSSSGASPAIFTFGLGSSSSTGAVGSGSGAAPPIFSSLSSSVSASGINTTSSFSSGTSGIFNFGGNSSASSSVTNSVSSNGAPSSIFGSSWQSPKSSIFGSAITSPSPSTGFSFGASSKSAAPANAASMVFNSTGASSSPGFPFASASTSASALPSPSLSINQPVFGNPPISGFGASPGNNDQMNAEDSMAEDPVQSSAPSIPVFGQPSVSPPPGFTFGSTVASQANPFMFGSQQNQVAPQNPTPFQASGSLEFNAGGSFSLGSGGGDKSGRKIVKINRNKNRKK
ncbi:UNVERIFIED_CONTAM: Nuclear pore complex protein [Sesamum radiatum]|uniref:Nuclear pore complex protein n=1 Tax=Sesamum radiatum TaxID=300843 RepID=A0AAW2KAX9_SESRA